MERPEADMGVENKRMKREERRMNGRDERDEAMFECDEADTLSLSGLSLFMHLFSEVSFYVLF